MKRKQLKLLWQIHWAVNIAPEYNGVGGKEIRYYTGRFSYSEHVTKKSPTNPLYSINLVELKERLVSRYNKISNA